MFGGGGGIPESVPENPERRRVHQEAFKWFVEEAWRKNLRIKRVKRRMEVKNGQVGAGGRRFVTVRYAPGLLHAAECLMSAMREPFARRSSSSETSSACWQTGEHWERKNNLPEWGSERIISPDICWGTLRTWTCSSFGPRLNPVGSGRSPQAPVRMNRSYKSKITVFVNGVWWIWLKDFTR